MKINLNVKGEPRWIEVQGYEQPTERLPRKRKSTLLENIVISAICSSGAQLLHIFAWPRLPYEGGMHIFVFFFLWIGLSIYDARKR